MAILLYIFSLNMKLSLWFVQHFSFFIKNINFFPQKSLDFMFPYLKWSLWDQNPKKFILSAEHCAPEDIFEQRYLEMIAHLIFFSRLFSQYMEEKFEVDSFTSQEWSS